MQIIVNFDFITVDGKNKSYFVCNRVGTLSHYMQIKLHNDFQFNISNRYKCFRILPQQI